MVSWPRQVDPEEVGRDDVTVKASRPSGAGVAETGRTGRRRSVGRWVAPLYLAMSLVLLPWIALLARTLPDRAESQNYRLGWVGFDVLLALAMGRTGYLAWRGSPFVVNVASATTALLVVDAWFDVTTAPAGEPLVQACALALGVEMPAAVLSMVIAGRAQRQIARTGIAPPAPRVVRALRTGRRGS